jgi:hypothetical protein
MLFVTDNIFTKKASYFNLDSIEPFQKKLFTTRTNLDPNIDKASKHTSCEQIIF